MYIRTVGTTGDSSVILNSLELLTENPTTLVVGGSEKKYYEEQAKYNTWQTGFREKTNDFLKESY